jgi:hypothetical protein
MNKKKVNLQIKMKFKILKCLQIKIITKLKVVNLIKDKRRMQEIQRMRLVAMEKLLTILVKINFKLKIAK